MNLKKHATVIILGLLAVGLVVYAYKDRESVTDVERAAREGDIFPAWRRDNVTRIELVRGSETLRLERRGDDGGAGSWHLTSPRDEVADYSAAENLLISLEHSRAIRKSTAPSSTLEVARARGTIWMGGVTYKFVLGDAAPTPVGASYFKLEGGGPIVVSRELTDALLAPAANFRSRAIVPYLSIQLDTMTMQGDGGDWKLVRATPLAFMIEPLHIRASRKTLDKIWGALSDTRADSFLSEDEAKKLTSPPRLRITMKPTDAQKPTAVLLIGGPCKDHPDDLAFYREAPEPLGACVPKSVLPALSVKPEALIDDGAFTARFDEIEELKLEAEGQKTIDVARMGSGFHLRSPEDRKLTGDDARSVQHLLEVIDKSDGAHARPGAQAPGPALARVTIRYGEGEEQIEVGESFFRRLMDNAVVDAPRKLTRQLLPRASLLRPTPVFPPAVADAEIESLDLRCGVFQSFTRNADGFVARAPQGLIPDQAALSGLADTLLRLRAEAWVSDFDRVAFATENTDCSASFTVRGEAGIESHTLYLGWEGDGGIYARADADPNVMLLPESAHDLLHAVYMDLDVVRPRGKVTRIKVTEDGKTTELLRGDETIAAFDQAEVLAFDKVLRLGDARPEDGLDKPSATIDIDSSVDGGASQHIRLLLGVRPAESKTYVARVEGIHAIYALAEGRLAAIIAKR